MTPAATPEELESLARWRLRPGVRATAVRDGVHLRGWRGAVTLEGSPALPGLWGLLEEALRAGDPAALCARAPSGTPLRGALTTLLSQLHAHGMLVESRETADVAAAPVTVPAAGAAPDGSAAVWLRAGADRPAAAAAAIDAAVVRVRGAQPQGPPAVAAARALARCGARLAPAAYTDGPGWQITLTARPGTPEFGAGPELAVVAAVSGGAGFVTSAESPRQARSDAAALARRLGMTTGRAPGDALVALVAGAAAQRLICAVAGLPDPATLSEDPRLLPGRPAVLVAQERPLRAVYRSWLGPSTPDAHRPGSIDAPRTLAEALHRVAALSDERLGVLPRPEPGALPQLPAALVSCPLPGGPLLAGAARADLARLDALCRAAELLLGAGFPGAVVGADPTHALGRALRRAVVHTLTGSGRAPAGPTAPGRSDHVWRDDPQAGHWWTVLTERLDARARLTVTALDPESAAGARTGVFHAVVHGPSEPGAPSRVLGRAVEATAGDAVAFAALAATVRIQAERHGVTLRHQSWPSGASAALAVVDAPCAPWEDDGWTAAWLTGLAGREQALHAGLRRLTGLRAGPWEPGGEPDGENSVTLCAALRAAGFTVLGQSLGTDGGVR